MIAETLINHLKKGHPLCYGLADKVSASQSGRRTLAKIAKDEKLIYFYADPVKKGRHPYKIFAKYKKTFELKKEVIKGVRLWYLTAYNAEFDQIYMSKKFRKRSTCLAQIKKDW